MKELCEAIFFGSHWLSSPESTDCGQSGPEAIGPILGNIIERSRFQILQRRCISPQLFQEDFDTCGTKKLCVHTRYYFGRDIAIGIFKFCSNRISQKTITIMLNFECGPDPSIDPIHAESSYEQKVIFVWVINLFF